MADRRQPVLSQQPAGADIETKLTPAATWWILTLNYAPEPSGFAPHATALAEYLSRRGHDVTVVTGFPFAPAWRRWPEYRRLFSSEEVRDRLTLRRVSHFIARRPGRAGQRAVMEASFCAAAALALAWTFLRKPRRPDVVLYIGAQPAIAMLARIIAWVSRTPYFVNINDLAAEAAADVGIVRHRWLKRLLEQFEFAAYRRSAGASVLCPSFAEALLARGYEPDRIRLIRSPVDLTQITPLLFTAVHRQRLGISTSAFVVLFAGSMGLKQGLTNVIAAADHHRAFRGAPRVLWVLVGDGESRRHLEALIREYDLADDVILLPFQPAAEVAAMLAAADVLLLNQLGTVRDAVVASKLLTYMAAGKPVLAAVNGRSQSAEIVRSADGGLLVRPDDPIALAGAVDRLAAADAGTLDAMGRRNRAYAERHFDQRLILAEHEAFVIERLAQLRRGREPQREVTH